jgi:ABC-type branched-subunit amino acid transport system ATPase component/ABC-type branched-subunit amino acid transport system permease subunit
VNFPTLGRREAIGTTTRPVLDAARNPGAFVWAVIVLTWGFVAPDYLVYTANAAMPVAIVALGLLVLVGWAREISLATAGLFASSMYIYGFLNRPGGFGIPWVPAALIVLTCSAGLMALLALSSARLPGFYLIALTLILQIVCEKTVFIYGRFSGGFGGGDERGDIVTNRRPDIPGLNILSDRAFYMFSLTLLTLTLVLVTRLRRSPAGLAFHLVGADRQAAAAVGISPLRFRVYAFATSGLLAGVGGILGCWLFINPPIFLNYLSPFSLVLLAIPVLAGLDSIAFVVVIATVFQLVPVLLESLHFSTFILAGVGLIGGSAFGSRGLGGRAHDAVRHLLHGDRRMRTRRRVAVDNVGLRAADGVGGTEPSNLTPAERAAALAILEAWLPPRPTVVNAVSATNIRVHVGGVQALDGASVNVPSGKMVGLVGPNGAGKTTLFDVVSGLRTPDAGKIELLGKDVTGRTAWDRAALGLARTFQSTRVMRDLTVRDNLLAGAYQRIKHHPLAFLVGVPGAWQELRRAEEVAWAAAQLLDIDRYWHERCGTLEFSARRRSEIGRCLLAGPRVLLLDEPAAGLDPASSLALFSLIRRLHADLGLTVLLVEHYVRAVLQSCDFVHVLAEGRILAAGTPEQVASDPEVQARYLGTRMRDVNKMTPTPVVHE